MSAGSLRIDQSAASARFGRMSKRVAMPLGRALYVVLILVGSWLIAFNVVGNDFVIPSLGAVWDSAYEVWRSGRLVSEASITILRIFVAFVAAVLVGATLGILIGRVTWIRLASRPLVAFLFPTPKAAVYPALVVIMGFGSASKIAFGFLEAVFPIILASTAAASQIDERLFWSARSFGTSRRASLSKIVLPAALPGILTGARVGLVGSIIGVFLGEMIVGTDGLGQLMTYGWRRLDTPAMYVAIIVVSLMGLILDRLFLAARNRALRWSHEATATGL